MMKAWQITIYDDHGSATTIVRAPTRGKALQYAASELKQCSFGDFIDYKYSQQRRPKLDGHQEGRVADWEMLEYVTWLECTNCGTKIYSIGSYENGVYIYDDDGEEVEMAGKMYCPQCME